MPDSSGELVGTDLANYTQGRLDGDDDATKAALAGALAAARRFCGWHVTPVRTDVVILDGPGSRLLVLPTLRLTALAALIEDGVTVDVDTLEWSTRGLVRKRNHGCWTHRYGEITATMTHGFDAAPDWQAAVLSLADRVSFAGVGGRPTVVGPFQYGTDTASLFSDAERSTLETYRLESPT